ncbi:DUF3500 domain-containing protein [Leifsonia aquatica]|uniref:DUF3500 domain-containing protein n=1 Tax=Leifsonia aquatica TaxID=144185 RepID=UPI0038509D97
MKSQMPAPARRRTLWIGTASALAISLTLAGCTAADTASPTSAMTSTATAGSGDVVALAKAFAATLSDDQTTELQQKYTFANASDWSNLPQALLTGGGFGGGAPGGGAPSGAPAGGAAPSGAGGAQSSTGRVGLQTSSLSDAQWSALENLIAAATGSAANEGFDEILQHLAADDYLSANGGGSDYGRGNFYIAFLGTPSDSGTWELQFGGHHLALANTYTDGELAGATPSFRGIEPFTTVTQDGVTVQPEQQEQKAFAAVIASLTTEQQTAAKLSKTYNDILLGPGDDWAFPTTSEGIKGSDLTADQKALVLAAIDTYVDDVDDADAATILAKYKSQLDDTYFSFSGSTAVTEIDDYVRIDGPSVWIEFSMQHGIVLDGAHPHAVWRDKVTDYGGTKS